MKGSNDQGDGEQRQADLHSAREPQRLHTNGETAVPPPSHKYTGSAGLVTLQDVPKVN